MAIRPLLGCACAVILCASGQVCTGAEALDAAKSTDAFGVDLYRTLAAREGNLFLSPYSIAEALALLSSGAKGTTREELLRTLHWEQAPGDMAAAFSAQGRQLDAAAQGGALLSVADGLWYQQGGAPSEAFRTIAREEYRAELRPADFIGNSAAVRPEINGWVEKKTSGKIPDLFPEGSLTRDTRLVLANAVYFKGRWEHPFEASETKDRPFFTTAERSVPVPTMSLSAHLRIAKAPDCTVLELPYKGGGLSMAILLPRERDGLGGLEQHLSPEKLAQWLGMADSAQPGEVAVRLPRFKVEYSAELTASLQGLGVTSAFEPGGADFSGIDGRHDLHVSGVFHKAYAETNEEGTVAAAATGVSVVTFAVEMSERFFADHPFLFVIRDARTGTLLFIGRIADPALR